jgi:hypothetical protein
LTTVFKKSDDSQPENSGFPRYDCLLCNVTGLQGEALVTHENGKKHQKNIGIEITTNYKQNMSGRRNFHAQFSLPSNICYIEPY